MGTGQGKSRSRGKLLVMERDANGESRGVEFRGYLKGDGDFRSREVKKLRDEADFIITNPPFSLFREFMSWISEGKKQFIVLSNKNAVKYRDIFSQFMKNEIWLGARPMGQDAYFILPEDYKTWVVANREEGSAYRMVDGEPMGRAGVCWLTNVDHWRRHTAIPLNTMEHNLKNNAALRRRLEKLCGNADGYPRYENYDAIEVPSIDAIPSDWDGLMGVPITFLDKFNPEQFEIVGISLQLAKPMSDVAKKGTFMAGGNCFYLPHPDEKDLANGYQYHRLYDRIVIRNRHLEPQNAPSLPDGSGAEAAEEEDEGLRPGL